MAGNGLRADELRPNERVRAARGVAEIVAVESRAEPAPVYNLEVYGTHVYQVAANGVLVHNGVACNPIQGLPRTGSALKTDPYHAFSNIVDNFASGSTATNLKNGAMLHQIEGSLNGVVGRFEWIAHGENVTHRMFVPGGILNGIPIKP